jgi:hypothetical protein
MLQPWISGGSHGKDDAVQAAIMPGPVDLNQDAPVPEQLLYQEEGLVALCQSFGMPAELITNHVLVNFVFPSFVDVYSEGDLQLSHPVPKDPRLTPWFGEREVKDGRFARQLEDLHQREPGHVILANLQRAFALSLARCAVEGGGPFTPSNLAAARPPIARIDKSEVVFGGNYGQDAYRESLGRPIRNVLAIGPGVRGTHAIDDQLKLRGQPGLFRYHAISQHRLMAQFLVFYLVLRARQLTGNDALVQAWAQSSVSDSKQGDASAVTQTIVEANRGLGQKHGDLDVALYTGYVSPKLTRKSTQPMMANICWLLRPGGALVLGFPPEATAEGRASMIDLMSMALAAGFSKKRPQTHLGTSNMSNPKLPIYTLFFKE